jgi:hypothetical protein
LSSFFRIVSLGFASRSGSRIACHVVMLQPFQVRRQSKNAQVVPVEVTS